jgi:acyl carrier protein
MKNEEIQVLVFECIKNYLETHEIEHDINGHTALIGTSAIIDSMGLVNIIVDIESELLDHDIEVSLTSEKAFSRKISPFRSINSLVTFTNEQINESSE